MTNTDATNETPEESAQGASILKAGGGVTRWFGNATRTWNSFLSDLAHRPRTRFLTILWAVVVIFLGITILTASNPLRLLIPGLAFPRPTLDSRPTVELRGVARTSNELIAYERRMAPDESVEAAVRKLAYIVSEPVGLREGMTEQKGYADLEPLPRLGFAVRQIWFRDKKSGALIVDFRRETLLKETSLFHKNRHRASVVPAEASEENEDNRSRRERKKESEQRALAQYLDNYFRSLTASIFTARPEVKSVTFLLNGESDTIEEMDFDLDVRYTR